MSAWAYIRGWVELTEEMLPVVYETLEASVGDAARFGVSEEAAAEYNDGWVLPDEPKVWAHYAFYGRDVARQHLPFVRHQMELIARIATTHAGDEERPLGVLHIGAEDVGDLVSVWELKEGRLREYEYPKPPAV
ncbi:MAG TPA: hypothetical protein VK610_03305 [Rhodothermales bacterium]|nr:hypothetical protein [Rhodothermales bacterium]